MTLRAAATLRCLRSTRVYPAVRRALASASRAEFRIVEYTVQRDHIHLIAEAENGLALSGGVRGLAIRLARAVKRVLGRRGRVWEDRYHARALATPRAVRHALIYVLGNFRKHGHAGPGIDPCSSAAWFNGWRVAQAPSESGPRPVAMAHTWLGRVGWRCHGLIGTDEYPKGRT